MTRKCPFFAFIVFTLLLAACAAKPSVKPFIDHVPARPYTESDYQREPVSGKTAIDYLRDEKIVCGWNLGSTMDAHMNGIAFETAWSNPAVNQELMNGVKAAGFDIIRIPITWMGNFGSAPDYRIMTNYLKRAAEIIGMARNAGLKVIINMHHDGATETGGKDTGWLSVARASLNQAQYEAITAQYARIWQQIAIYFKNYGDWLIFESFNELHDGSWQNAGDFRYLLTVNKWNQVFVDAVRSTGSNNETRYLMTGAYCNDNHQALSPAFALPQDTAADKLIVSFHYYYPSNFTLNSRSASWGTPADKEKVESDFAPFKEKFIDKNIPVIIGECGAVLQLYPGDPAKETQARQSRFEYIPYVFSAAKKYGLIPVYWDNGVTSGNYEKFGLLNRLNGQSNSQDSGALVKLMISAVK